MGGTSAEKVTQCHNTLTCYIMTSACHSASVLLTCQQKHQKQHTVLPVPSCFKWICITASLHEIWVNYTVIIHEHEIRLLWDSSYRCQPAGSESIIPTLLHEMHSEDYTTALQPVPAPFQVSGCPKEPSRVTILGRSDGPAAEAWKGIGIELQGDSISMQFIFSKCSYIHTGRLPSDHGTPPRLSFCSNRICVWPADVITLRGTYLADLTLVEVIEEPNGCAKSNLLRHLQLVGQLWGTTKSSSHK
jgi:hypothetical protein